VLRTAAIQFSVERLSSSAYISFVLELQLFDLVFIKFSKLKHYDFFRGNLRIYGGNSLYEWEH
jgi:hypothetical protein